MTAELVGQQSFVFIIKTIARADMQLRMLWQTSTNDCFAVVVSASVDACEYSYT
jgi:hypothetical protein